MLGAEEQAEVLSGWWLRRMLPVYAPSSPRRGRPQHTYSTMKIFRSW